MRKILSLNEIKEKGIKALYKELGPIGMVRFLQQFDLGRGDYTKDRKKWLKEKSVDTIIKEIKKKRHIGTKKKTSS